MSTSRLGKTMTDPAGDLEFEARCRKRCKCAQLQTAVFSNTKAGFVQCYTPVSDFHICNYTQIMQLSQVLSTLNF